MLIHNHRFGSLEIANEHVFLFPSGLVGMERSRQWALVPDQENEAMAWLLSTTSEELSLPVISPRRFFPDYRVRVSDRDIVSLRLRPGSPTYILATISDRAGQVTANLRAPILLNMRDRIGIQAITTDLQSHRQPLPMDRQFRAVA